MITRLPPWFKQEIPDAGVIEMMRLIRECEVNTVCREAKCPNLARCFKEKRATFMILGRECTRSCGFCAVDKAKNPLLPPDSLEPEKVALLVKRLGLEYAVITSVTRDDLSDGGGAHFAAVIEKTREFSSGAKIEALVPDFAGSFKSLNIIIDANPSVLAHNLETVERIFADLRPASDYSLSLSLLSAAKMHKASLTTKSSLMLGLGEREDEVVKAMEDLRESGCDMLTLGQYLAPSERHYRMREFISPEQFNRYRCIGLSLGFKAVSSGPLVRSSYEAQNSYQELNYA